MTKGCACDLYWLLGQCEHTAAEGPLCECGGRKFSVNTDRCGDCAEKLLQKVEREGLTTRMAV